MPVFFIIARFINSVAFLEKSGKTLALLKNSSKPQAPRTKRKKVELLGSFKEYKESKQKPAQPKEERQFSDVSMLAPLPNTGQPLKEDLKKKK